MSAIVTLETTGRLLPLEESLGSGKQGRVYTVRKCHSLAAKVVAKPDSEFADRLAAMIGDRNGNGPIAAKGFEAIMPQARLFDATGTNCMGYTMDRVRNAVSWACLCDPAVRSACGIQVNFAFLVRMAVNLCHAVHALGCRGYVICDLNPSNVLVLPDASIRIIDLDSCAILYRGKFFGSNAWSEMCSPPEWQVGGAAGGCKPSGMYWSLTVMIFLLLNDDQHPFPPEPGRPTSNMTEGERVRFGEFIYRQGDNSPAKRRLRPENSLSPFERDPYRATFESGRNDPSKRRSAIFICECMQALEESVRPTLRTMRAWPSTSKLAIKALPAIRVSVSTQARTVVNWLAPWVVKSMNFGKRNVWRIAAAALIVWLVVVGPPKLPSWNYSFDQHGGQPTPPLWDKLRSR